MTEALFSITPAGELISARYYTITRDTLNRRIISAELIEEILWRSSSAQGIRPGVFTFQDLQVDILIKYDYKIEFFVSRGVPISSDGRHFVLYN